MEILALYRKHSKQIEKYKKQIEINNYSEIMSQIYNYVKSVSKFYFNGQEMHGLYDSLKFDVLRVENNSILRKKIIDVNPLFYNNTKDIGIIENVVNYARKALIDYKYYITSDKSYEELLKLLDPTNQCLFSAENIQKYCDNNKIQCQTICIWPGYDKIAELFDGDGWHYFNIIKYNGDEYLIDVTYQQFFYQYKNNLDRLGITNLSGCKIGTFMLMSDEGKEIAKSILEHGFIKLNDRILKKYLDAFTISFRNGLYYEETSDFQNDTEYTIDDYWKFLKGEDSQIKHESREYLGYQKRPLQDFKFNFKQF